MKAAPPAGFWNGRVGKPLKELFVGGWSPEKITQCLVIGSALSLFPIMGATSVLCAGAALWLKLNLPAIQVVNWLWAGVQLILIIPYIHVGQSLIGGPPFTLAGNELAALARQGWAPFVNAVSGWLGQALVGWLVTTVPLALLAYGALLWFLRRKMRVKPSSGESCPTA